MTRYAPIALFLILAVFLAVGLTRDPSAIPTEMIDQDMPIFELSQLNADAPTVSENDLRGEIVLLNVFGSWCVACLQEHPTLMQLAQEERIKIVGLNWRDTRAEAQAWLNKHGDPYDTIIFDQNSDLVIELGVTGAPETFVIDREGRIRYKHVGPILPPDWFDKIRPRVLALMATTEDPNA